MNLAQGMHRGLALEGLLQVICNIHVVTCYVFLHLTSYILHQQLSLFCYEIAKRTETELPELSTEKYSFDYPVRFLHLLGIMEKMCYANALDPALALSMLHSDDIREFFRNCNNYKDQDKKFVSSRAEQDETEGE